VSRRTDIIGVIDPTGTVIVTGTITVTSTATKIPAYNCADRKAISIRNWSDTEIVYIGGAGVTVATGFPILPKESLPLDAGAGVQAYGICNTGKSAEIRYIEIDNG